VEEGKQVARDDGGDVFPRRSSGNVVVTFGRREGRFPACLIRLVLPRTGVALKHFIEYPKHLYVFFARSTATRHHVMDSTRVLMAHRSLGMWRNYRPPAASQKECSSPTP